MFKFYFQLHIQNYSPLQTGSFLLFKHFEFFFENFSLYQVEFFFSAISFYTLRDFKIIDVVSLILRQETKIKTQLR